MKKVITLLLLLAALFTESPQSKAQVIYSQNFDTSAFAGKKPTGWTDSIFNFAGIRSTTYPYTGYPTWYQDNAQGYGQVNGSYYYLYCQQPGTSNYYYDPLGFASSNSGPYGTTYGYYEPYFYPISHGGGNTSCSGAGWATWSSYYTGLGNYYAYNYASPSSPLFPGWAEFATPPMNFNNAYVANGGQGSVRLQFYLYTYYLSSSYTNQVKVYINTVPSSQGGTLIDSIYPFGNAAYSSPYGYTWTQFQYTLPSGFNTASKAYVIFRASVTYNMSYYPYDIDLDDVSVTYIPPCPAPVQLTVPTNLQFTTSASIVNGSFTAPTTPPTGGYLVVRSIGPLVGSPVNSTTYAVGSTFGANGTVISTANSTTFQDVALTPGTAYTYTIYPYSAGSACTITYYTNGGAQLTPLVGTITTGSTNTYTWNRIVSAPFTTPTNWTPSRVVPDPTDILVFDNGISDTATGVPLSIGSTPYSQGIGRLSIANNTQAHLRSTSAGLLTTNVNGIANATGVDVGVGSGLILDGTGGLTLAFGPGSLPNIQGNLEVSNTTSMNYVNFNNAVATIGASGQLAAGGTNNSSSPFLNNTTANLIINGTYNHKYTTVGGFVPVATWNPGSTLLISGYTTSTAGPAASGLAQTFPNFVYNASSQTSVCNWTGAHLKVTGTFNITSTGTGTWALASTQAYNDTLNNFVQAGGTLDLSTGASVAAGTQVLTLTGTFNQLGGNIKSSGTLTTQPNLFFNGTSGTQNVTLSNAPAGPIVYRVGNAAGINLVGINSLGSTPVLAINSGGGVRISTTAANPINTSLLLQYATTNSTLTFDTAGNITATAAVWPSTTAPFNVVINVNTGNAVQVPFNATIPGTLTFLSGDIDMSSYGLTIGNSTLATNQGTIMEPAGGTSYANVLGNGNVRLTTGSLTRWFGTAGLPIAANVTAGNGLTSQGFFPVSYGPSNRNVSVFFSAANALGAGGTITLTHNAATGTSALNPTVNDGEYRC